MSDSGEEIKRGMNYGVGMIGAAVLILIVLPNVLCIGVTFVMYLYSAAVTAGG